MRSIYDVMCYISILKDKIYMLLLEILCNVSINVHE